MPRGSGDPEVGFDIKTNLRSVMAALKEFDPALAREVRKAMRNAGEAAQQAMGEILDNESGGTVTGHTKGIRRDSKGRLRRVRTGNKVSAAKRSSSTGARQEIKSGLTLRVTTGKTRTSARLTTTKGDLRKAYNKRSWRHPVFGTGAWVEQPGNRYFNRGAYAKKAETIAALNAAIQVAQDAIAKHISDTTE